MLSSTSMIIDVEAGAFMRRRRYRLMSACACLRRPREMSAAVLGAQEARVAAMLMLK